MNRRQPVGSLCPTDPAHGPLLDLDGRPYCPHQAHDQARIRPARKLLPQDQDHNDATHDGEPCPSDACPYTLSPTRSCIAGPAGHSGPHEWPPAPKRRTVVDYTGAAPAGFRFEHVSPATKPVEPTPTPVVAPDTIPDPEPAPTVAVEPLTLWH